MAEQPKQKGNGDADARAVFHYIKSNSFRVIHVDGCVGSLTPHLNIHMALFSERPAIPQRVTHKVVQAGGLGELIQSETVSRDGFVREIDVDVVMNLSVATSLHKWLGDKIDELKQVSPERRKA